MNFSAFANDLFISAPTNCRYRRPFRGCLCQRIPVRRHHVSRLRARTSIHHRIRLSVLLSATSTATFPPPITTVLPCRRVPFSSRLSFLRKSIPDMTPSPSSPVFSQTSSLRSYSCVKRLVALLPECSDRHVPADLDAASGTPRPSALKHIYLRVNHILLQAGMKEYRSAACRPVSSPSRKQ